MQLASPHPQNRKTTSLIRLIIRVRAVGSAGAVSVGALAVGTAVGHWLLRRRLRQVCLHLLQCHPLPDLSRELLWHTRYELAKQAILQDSRHEWEGVPIVVMTDWENEWS